MTGNNNNSTTPYPESPVSIMTDCMDEQRRQLLLSEELKDRLEVMFWQEQSHYKTVDYLQQEEHAVPHHHPFLQGDQQVMNVNWREKMCDWAYQLIDHCDLPREIVGTCMNYLDRYLMRYFGNAALPILGKQHFQLATMTCLYLAAKLHQGRAAPLSMDFMVRLSRNSITKAQLQAMEQHVCQQLGWLMHPPTAFDFGKHYLRLIFSAGANDALCKDMEESASFLVELSVLDYYFVTQRPSTVALAALYLVMEEHAQRLLALSALPTTTTSRSKIPATHPMAAMCDYLEHCRAYLGSFVAPEEYHRVDECRQRLASLYATSTGGTVTTYKPHGRTESPTSVLDSPSGEP